MINKFETELITLKQRIITTLKLVLLIPTMSMFSSQSQAAVIGNFDTGVDVDISSSVAQNEFGTDLFEELVFILGSASGSNSGSSFSDQLLGANEVGTVSAAASGLVNSGGGFVQSSWETDGYFYFENNTGTDITVDVTFDISWFANIFTSSNDEEVYATAGVFIENWEGDSVFAEWIELDSLIQGPGAFSVSDSFSVNFSFVLADGDFEEYALIVDSFGFAESVQQVPEPVGIVCAGFVFLFAFRERKRLVG